MTKVSESARQLKAMRKEAGLTVIRTARALGLEKTTYASKEDKFKKPFFPIDFVRELVPIFVEKGISEERIWALAGVTPAGSAVDEGAPPRKKRSVVETTEKDIESIPIGTVRVDEIDIRAGLGGGGLVDAVNVTTEGRTMSRDVVKASWAIPRNYLSERGLSKDGIYLFRAVGDSMTKPDGSGIHSGDLLLADVNDKHPVPPGIFALDNGFGVVVKRLEFVSYSDPPMLNVISDNPDHPLEKLAAEQVRVIGRCVWYGRWI